MSHPVRRALVSLAGLVLAAPLLAGATGPGASADEAPARADDLRRVVYVGNNWDGTADVLLPGSFRRVGRIDIVPDREERMAEIQLNPYRLAYFLAIRQLIGEVFAKVPDKQVMSDLDAAVKFAGRNNGDTSKLAITGFCWGGRVVWMYAAHNSNVKARVA